MNKNKATHIGPNLLRKQSRQASYCMFRVAVGDVEACWRRRADTARFADCYVPRGGEVVKGKRARFERFAEKCADKVVAPWVLFVPNESGLTIKFLDGRHRTAVLRDAGAEYINVQTDNKSYQNALNHGIDITPI